MLWQEASYALKSGHLHIVFRVANQLYLKACEGCMRIFRYRLPKTSLITIYHFVLLI